MKFLLTRARSMPTCHSCESRNLYMGNGFRIKCGM